MLNNPLSYSDPSGYFSFKDFARLALSVTISFYTGGAALAATTIGKAVAIGAAGGFLSGAIATGTWEGALSGAFVGAVAGGLGQGLQGVSWAAEAGKLTTAGRFAHSAGVGVASGVTAELQGGKFGHSFLALMGAATTGELIGTLNLGSEMQFVAEVVAGGAISEASGGKFANGAVTAAMNFAVAGMAGSSRGPTMEEALQMSDADFDAWMASRANAEFDPSTAIAWQMPGTAAGENAAMYWARRHVETGNPLYAIPGIVASLWTPDTYMDTALTLIPGAGFGRWAARPFWQYYPAGNSAYSSTWLARGWGWRPPRKQRGHPLLTSERTKCEQNGHPLLRRFVSGSRERRQSDESRRGSSLISSRWARMVANSGDFRHAKHSQAAVWRSWIGSVGVSPD